MILSLVYLCSYLGPFITYNDHCRSENLYNICTFEDALTQLISHYNLALDKLAQSFMLSQFGFRTH